MAKRRKNKKHNFLTLPCPSCKGAGARPPGGGMAPVPCDAPWCHNGRALLPYENIAVVAFGSIERGERRAYYASVRARYWPKWRRPPFSPGTLKESTP